MSARARLVASMLRFGGLHRRWRTESALLRSVERRIELPAWAPVPVRPDVRLGRATIAGSPVAVFTPRGADPEGTLVHLHGGGYVFAPSPQHWWYAAAIAAESGWRVVLPRYPLAPGHTADDTVPAIARLAVQVAASGPLALGGDSAGGGLALAVALQLRDAHALTPPLALVAPWLDLTFEDPALEAAAADDPWLALPGLRAAARLYRGGLAASDPRVSPGLADPSGLGPVTLVTGTRDTLHPESLRFATALRAAGVPLALVVGPRMLHDYPLMPIPEARQARRAVGRWLRAAGAGAVAARAKSSP